MISKFKKMPLFNKVRFFVCIGVILLSILLFVYGQFRISALSDIHDADLKTLSDLNSKSTMDEVVSTPDSVSDFKVYSATEAGNKVAKILNAMQTFDESMDVAIYRDGHLQCANTYPFDRVEDAGYYADVFAAACNNSALDVDIFDRL